MKKALKLSTIAGAFLVLAIPGAAHASDGTITFNGAVTSSTCTVKVNGGGADGTVTLPTVSVAALTAAGATAGSTPFTLDISSCTTGAQVTAYFEAGSNVDATTGRLNNTAPSGATNVQLQLYLGSAYASKIAVGQSNQNSAASIASGQLQYGVEYYANGGAAGAGAVSSTVTYSLVYG